MSKNNNSQNSVMGTLVNNCPRPAKIIYVQQVKCLNILIVMLAILSHNHLKAQFKTASVANISYNNTTSYPAAGTGNMSSDIDRTTNTGNNTTTVLSATAWDGANGGIGWSYTDANNTTTSGILDYDASYIGYVRHPDIQILRWDNTSNYFLVVAFYDYVHGGAFVSHYTFTPSTTTWSSATTTTLSGSADPISIRLDANYVGYIVVVWDETVSGVRKLKAKGGNINSSNVLTWSGNNLTFGSFTDPATSNTISPPFERADVGVFNNGGTDVATFCFITPWSSANSLVITQDITFGTITSGGTLSTQTAFKVINFANNIILNPRIARHKRVNSVNQTGWTVVFYRYTYTTGEYDICGNTTFYDVPNSSMIDNNVRVYTNGNNGNDGFWDNTSIYLPDINDNFKWNINPTVSYERRSGSDDKDEEQVAAIAFIHYESSTFIPLSFYIQNGSGRPYTNTNPATRLFYEVPYSPVGDEDIITVSGEESRRFLYSWRSATTPYEVKYKIVDGKANLRMMSPNDDISSSIIISHGYALPFNMPVDFKEAQIYSTSGVHIKTAHSVSDVIAMVDNVKSGLYLSRFIMNDGTPFTRKIIIR